MAAKKDSVTYEDIVRDVRAGRFAPVYYLMGDEAYYIDRVSGYIVDCALKEEERDFNLTVLYGTDTDVQTVVNAAKRYPMMAERQVVLVREAQSLANKEILSYYLEQPQPTTVLILCHKHGVLDRRKKLAGDIQKTGVLYESKKLYESQLPSFVVNYMKRKGVAIDMDAALLMSEYVGSDLNRMAGELDKLALALTATDRRVTSAFIEAHIGISKDYNNFELLNALVHRDVLKANRIIKFFNSNPRNYPIQVTLSVLFNFFSNLMLAYYAPQKTEEGIADWLEQPRWQVAKNVLPAMKKYSGVKVMQIISELRQTDAKAKGVGNPNTSDGELLRQLVYFILH
ncbi:MAG: DNA polymerase III subunit delta [Clostridium sp.]|nr:DNA polymerase III subunit delta [Clostridium sp.]